MRLYWNDNSRSDDALSWSHSQSTSEWYGHLETKIACNTPTFRPFCSHHQIPHGLRNHRGRPHGNLRGLWSHLPCHRQNRPCLHDLDKIANNSPQTFKKCVHTFMFSGQGSNLVQSTDLHLQILHHRVWVRHTCYTPAAARNSCCHKNWRKKKFLIPTFIHTIQVAPRSTVHLIYKLPHLYHCINKH